MNISEANLDKICKKAIVAIILQKTYLWFKYKQ